jgi:hypothetical protein
MNDERDELWIAARCYIKDEIDIEELKQMEDQFFEERGSAAKQQVRQCSLWKRCKRWIQKWL